MKGKKLLIPLICALALAPCCSCGEENNEVEEPNGNQNAEEEVSFAAAYNALPEIPFSTYCGSENDTTKIRMKVPYTDTYSVTFRDSIVKKVTFYNADGEEIISSEESFSVELTEGETVYADFVTANGKIKVDIKSKTYGNPLPFSVIKGADLSSYNVNLTSEADPLVASPIEYVKREGGLYVYTNTPEDLHDEVINKALTRQDITDREVFFTFEHNTSRLSKSVYYGYRVLNTGTDDMFVTVKNIGFQVAGPGSYYGESEWTQFYNTKFALPNMENWTESQHKNFDAYYGMCGYYMVPDFQPTTYRVPAGKYIYVIGGTTKDAHNNYNVAKTANQLLKGDCQNGAVLFEVKGAAEGAFFVYDDAEAIRADRTSNIGASDPIRGRCYNGTDEGFVVDSSAEWTFNDKTPAQALPVTFTNSYLEGVSFTGEPFTKIASTPHQQTLTKWYSHANVQGNHEAVGTDMTDFHTVDAEGNPVIIGCDYYDITGKLANIGNWMKDYIERLTFVNGGDTDRTVSVKLVPYCGGALVAMVRDDDGKPIKGTEYIPIFRGETDYGEAIDEPFYYEVVVKAHSVKRIHIEYNLMANSNGGVSHEVTLK